MFPSFGEITEAEESSARFLACARKRLKPDALDRLRLVPVNPGKLACGENSTLWGGEYLSRTLRFVYHGCEPLALAQAGRSWERWTTLLVSRDPQWGPCAFQTAEQDVVRSSNGSRHFSRLPRPKRRSRASRTRIWGRKRNWRRMVRTEFVPSQRRGLAPIRSRWRPDIPDQYVARCLPNIEELQLI